MVKTANREAANLSPVAVVEPEVAEASASSKSVQAATKGKGGLLAFTANQSKAAEAKVTLRQTIRQHLAEVQDMAANASEVTGEVAAKAGETALELYEARVSGQLSPAEVTDILGDIFGVNGTGSHKGTTGMRPGVKNAGKTPSGMGEEIRKRVQRAYAGYDYIHNGLSPATKYYEPFEPSDVEPLIDQATQDGTSFWQFYNDVSQAKRELSDDPIPFHLNPERVAKLATSLGEDVKATASKINSDPDLKAAWAGTLQTLLVINDLID